MGVVVAANGGGGGGDGQNPRKRGIENLDGLVGLDVSKPKFKRRKVSANRNFPIGCGYIASAPPIRVNLEENVVSVDSLVAGNVDVDEATGVGVVTDTHLYNFVEIEIVDGIKSEQSGMPDSVKSSSSCGSKLNGDHVSEESSKAMDLYSSNRMLQKKYPPRKRISASRDFPRGYGRNAPPINHEEYRKFDTPSTKMRSENDTFSKEMEQMNRIDPKEKINKEHSQFKLDEELKKDKARDCNVGENSRGILKQKDTEAPRRLSYENLAQFDFESPSHSKKVGKMVRAAEVKEKLGKETSFNRKLSKMSEDSNSLNQLQKEVATNFKAFKDRVIVQALMAMPNCPWRQGKGSFKSPISAFMSAPKTKPKPQLPRGREKKGKIVSSKGETTKKNVPLTGEGVVDDAGEQVFKNDQVSSGNDEESENAFSIPRLVRGRDLSLIPFGHGTSIDGDAISIRNQVRETLRLFQTLCRKYLRDEEANTNNQASVKRIDIFASKVIKDKNKYLNREKMLGPVPGVEVGDEFHYRVELGIVGLHHILQGGIDYFKKGSTVLATSIVASGGYDNDTDRPDVLIYMGQGGNSTGDKRAEDQKLERGNLSLKNSMDAKTPVRVIRGYKEPKAFDSDAKGKSVTTYTYDGLYTVDKFWTEQARQGNNIFKFELRRIPGQPELALREVKNSNKLRARKGLCVDDISQGKEKIPIPAFNTIDDSKPPPFEYITKMIYPSWYNLVPPKGCDCISGCSDSAKCFCAVKNGGELPFNHNGAIVEAKALVHECGPSCKCPPSCPNRVGQKGIKFQLEIFRTESRGWGVRSIDSIPSGSFICEYTGELLQDKEAEQRTSDEYLFDIGHNYNDPSLWGGLSTFIPPALQCCSSEAVEDLGVTIDAAQYGSVGRFINHSCSPNLYAQNVLYDHDDKRMPHIMLFATENIPPLQELTYHYNYQLDQVYDSDGNIKKKSCYCGSPECSGRMY